MISIPEYIRSLKPYIPGKPVEETQRELGIRKVIKLASNENPLGPPPRAVAAMRKALKQTHLYPDGSAYYLKAKLAKRLAVQTNQLLVGNGSEELISLLVRTLCVPGDAIVTGQASFIVYKIVAQALGVTTWEVPVGEDLKFDLNQALEAIRSNERIRLVFLANPNNPTGTYFSEAELTKFLDEVQTIRNGSVVVVLDYAYWEYVTTKDLPDPMKLQKKYSHVVVLRTFSKVYGLASIRIGYAIASAEVISFLERVRLPFNINGLGLVAAHAALDDRAFVRESRSVNETGRKLWEKFLKKESIPFWPSQCNFILVDTQAGTGFPGTEIFQRCLEKGVIFRPVANYGLPNCLRLSIGKPSENRTAIKVFSSVLKEIKK